MSGDDDEKWLAALAGRERLEDELAQRQIDALRRAIQEDHRDSAGLEDLMRRLEAEGLLEDRAPAQGRWYALAASAVLLVGASLVGYQTWRATLPPPWESADVMRAGDVAPAEVAVEDPAAASLALASALRARDIDVDRYRYRGRWILDATVLGMDVPAVDSLLREYGVTVAEDGRVLIAFDRR
jgi:hypothetical protein